MTTVLGPRMIACRKALGWSQDRLASESGVSQSRISRIERGKESSTGELEKISAAFHITMIDLLDAKQRFEPRVTLKIK